MVEIAHRKCGEEESAFQGQSRLGGRSHEVGGNQERLGARDVKRSKHFNKGMLHVAVNNVKWELN